MVESVHWAAGVYSGCGVGECRFDVCGRKGTGGVCARNGKDIIRYFGARERYINRGPVNGQEVALLSLDKRNEIQAIMTLGKPAPLSTTKP